MEPTNIECNLRCPEDGQEVTVSIDCHENGKCCVTRCSHFGENSVTCAQECLDSVTKGTHWDSPNCGCSEAATLE